MAEGFKIKSLSHPLVKEGMHLRKEASFKKGGNTLLITGKKQIEQLPSHIKIETLYTTSDAIPLRAKYEKHLVVSEEILKKITGLLNPEPYAAIIRYKKKIPTKIEKLLVCDQISDPGNLGSIIRAAHAFEFSALFILGNCVDPFNDKVLRAAKGSIFHLPLLSGNFEELLFIIRENNLLFFQADLEGKKLNELKEMSPFALAVGNEANGTSNEVKKKAQAITIPMSQNLESLNVAVAAGILMYNLSELCQKTITT
jgi:TrmH family RNA methyltransferase